MTPVALGLGSNKKFSDLRPEEILGGAIFELSKILHGIEISSVYRTKAMYVLDQEDFYNMALAGLLDDGTSARALLEKIHEIEAAFGREREKEIRFGPRSLDIDIELFGRQKILEPDLQIPHPRLKERAFVLIPLSEVLDNLENKRAAAQNARQDGDFPHEKNLANAMERSDDAPAARAACQIISSNATAWNADAQAARAASQITSTHAKPQSGNAQAAQPVNQDESPSIIETQIISTNAMERSSDAPAAQAATQIISYNATAWNADAQAARAATQIISTHATTRSVDNIKGEIFCLCRDEISAALSSLGETDGGVEKIIRAQDFLPFIKSRLQDGRCSR